MLRKNFSASIIMSIKQANGAYTIKIILTDWLTCWSITTIRNMAIIACTKSWPSVKNVIRLLKGVMFFNFWLRSLQHFLKNQKLPIKNYLSELNSNLSFLKCKKTFFVNFTILKYQFRPITFKNHVFFKRFAAILVTDAKYI